MGDGARRTPPASTSIVRSWSFVKREFGRLLDWFSHNNNATQSRPREYIRVVVQPSPLNQGRRKNDKIRCRREVGQQSMVYTIVPEKVYDNNKDRFVVRNDILK